MKHTSAAILALLAFAGCDFVSSDPSAAPEIIGGINDPADPAVGLLRLHTLFESSIGVCTATLIASNVMVTAAHCADATLFDVSFAARPNLAAALGDTGYVRATVIADPDYTGDPRAGHDVAVVLLSGSTTIRPVAIGAAPAKGATVRAVGYGMNVFGTNGAGIGVKRRISIPVRSVAAHEIVTGTDGRSTCHGDSGGPLFDSAGRIVATTSYGDTADCRGTSHDMRLDDNLDFLGQFLDGGGGTGGGGTGGGGTGGGGSGSGGGSGQPGRCRATQGQNEIECLGTACTCRVAGQEVGTCTATEPATCSFSSNCCGF